MNGSYQNHGRRLWQKVECKKCHTKIVFLLTKNNKFIPVDLKTTDPNDVAFDHTRHTSHFATCTEPEFFRRKK